MLWWVATLNPMNYFQIAFSHFHIASLGVPIPILSYENENQFPSKLIFMLMVLCQASL